MTYNDFVELQNKFKEQCIYSQYDVANLPCLNEYFSILNLKNITQPACEFTDLINTPYDDEYNLIHYQKTIALPVVGVIYTDSKCDFSLRKYTSMPGYVVNTDFKEFETAYELLKDHISNIMILAKYRNFSDLASYVAARALKVHVNTFCNLKVSAGKTSFQCFCEAIERFYTHVWIAYYIDVRLAEKYLGNTYIEVVKNAINFTVTNLIKKRITKYVGLKRCFEYVLNTKVFSDNMWKVNVLCPGVMIGHVPAVITYGHLLSDIMIMGEDNVL